MTGRLKLVKFPVQTPLMSLAAGVVPACNACNACNVCNSGSPVILPPSKAPNKSGLALCVL